MEIFFLLKCVTLLTNPPTMNPYDNYLCNHQLLILAYEFSFLEEEKRVFFFLINHAIHKI